MMLIKCSRKLTTHFLNPEADDLMNLLFYLWIFAIFSLVCRLIKPICMHFTLHHIFGFGTNTFVRWTNIILWKRSLYIWTYEQNQKRFLVVDKELAITNLYIIFLNKYIRCNLTCVLPVCVCIVLSTELYPNVWSLSLDWNICEKWNEIFLFEFDMDLKIRLLFVFILVLSAALACTKGGTCGRSMTRVRLRIYINIYVF